MVVVAMSVVYVLTTPIYKDGENATVDQIMGRNNWENEDCVCRCLILKGERGIECIFVGYADHSKAFRLFVIEPNESVSINSIIESRDDIFNENRLSSVPIPSLSIPKGTEDIGGLVVPEKVTEEVVQQPEPELRKEKGIRLQRTLDLNFNYT
ncbi:hypothetical protein Tco_1240900 [Tanacetum coccineum]